MRFAKACQPVQGFVVGTECNEYGPRSVTLDPAGFERFLGIGRFAFTYRYLFTMHLAVAYAVRVPMNARVSVQGLRADDVVKGDVVILRETDEGPDGLSDFEVDTIRSNLSMFTDDRGNFYRLENTTPARREMAVGIDA